MLSFFSSHAFGVLGSSPIAIEAVKFQTVEPRETAPLHAYVHVRPQYVNSNKWHQYSAEYRVFSMLSYSLTLRSPELVEISLSKSRNHVVLFSLFFSIP